MGRLVALTVSILLMIMMQSARRETLSRDFATVTHTALHTGRPERGGSACIVDTPRVRSKS